ncbi:hypothetical protein [Magnetospirillum sulfuroxidans]|uniref:hypothetical protein n=1 Tax=Magnetospirillum sulfuroxidans TaxID=611300 RepID=UPI001B8B6756|nr:hypothetical protein [Magnetospirillum sulfuroxidans]
MELDHSGAGQRLPGIDLADLLGDAAMGVLMRAMSYALLAVSLVACANDAIWRNHSVTNEQAQRDWASCKLVGMQAGAGGGAYYGPQPGDVMRAWGADIAAAGRRDEAIAYCMQAKGYRLERR